MAAIISLSLHSQIKPEMAILFDWTSVYKGDVASRPKSSSEINGSWNGSL
jgi:hypothetical protein